MGYKEATMLFLMSLALFKTLAGCLPHTHLFSLLTANLLHVPMFAAHLIMQALAKVPNDNTVVEIVPSMTTTIILPEMKVSHKADCHAAFHNSLPVAAPGFPGHTSCSPFTIVQEPITRTQTAPGTSFTQSVPDDCGAGSGSHQPPSDTSTPITSSQGSTDGNAYTIICIGASMLLAGFMAHILQ